jgi:pimeloyl-ACP methyl ester carboxylesterase
VSTKLELPDSKWVHIDGPVHYREWPGPEGLTFVCVHGLGGSLLNWIAVAPDLSRMGRVLAVDLAGFGLTPREGRSASVLANRRLLSRFMAEVSDGPVVLVGNSMGGAISILQASREPGSVDGLILTSPALPVRPRALPKFMVLYGFAVLQVPELGERALRRRWSRLGPERLVEETFRMCCADPSRIDEAIVALHVAGARRRETNPDAIPAFLEATRSLMRLATNARRGRAVLDGVRCPVLLIQGQEDRLVNVRTAIAAARRRPDWRVRVLEDVGHVAQLEAPDRWLAEVRDWIATQPSLAKLAQAS